MTDEELAEAVKKGDDSSFQELMRRYLKQIYLFAKHYARTEEDAEDISQDAFFKAWKHIKQFKRGKTFKPWLFAIARNTSLDFLKKRRAVVFSDLDDSETDLSFADTLTDAGPSAHEIFEAEELRDELSKAMAVLHPDHRSVLILHYQEEMTFDEIAFVMGRPMNTVKSWHRRAVERMRTKIRPTIV